MNALPWTTIRACIAMLDPPLRLRWAGLVVLAAGAALLETIGTGVVFGLISVVNDIEILARLPVLGPQLSELARQNQAMTLVVLGLAVVVFFVAKNCYLYFQIYNQEKTGFDTTSIVSDTLLRGYLQVDYTFHFRRNSAQLIQTLEYAVDDSFRSALLSAVIMVSEILVAMGIVTVLLVSEPKISLVTALVLGLLMLGTLTATRRAFSAMGARIQVLQAQVIQAMQQALGAVKEAKVLGREDFFADRYGGLYRERSQYLCRASVLQQMPRLAMETLMVAGMVLVITLVVLGADRREAVLPTLALFGYAGFRLQPSLNRIVLYFNNIRKGAAATQSISGDWQRLRLAAAPLSHPAPLDFTRQLELDAVRYTYPGGDREILKGVTLTVRRGSSIGIAGTTGAGKSTLIDVVLGLLSPTGGRVLVDGVDIAADPRAWQRKIGYVPQVIYLTDDTLRRNIALGIPDGEIDDECIRRAISLAQLDDVVAVLPQGLDTRLGERGINLSGGQRQRIGVARALYNEPELLIFDEATSSLDSETEREVSRAIEALSGEKTVILIAHRLSTLHKCSEIILLKDGVVAGRGSYDDMISGNDDFRRMTELSQLPSATAGEG
ncbi:ABC transporter ATP-binding protein [Paramagnetospirillum magnetotacticum MS-1]|uniref:ABC transporter ATP-binding protein n=1 Tax=Paramagnetospirillum magnetotacticum MS-1 TaxID=272627 RepID=A0A0C2YSM7_PARME|nr:ABC transporter ATP-binding protein [Paramagnetospirillum magnetotacticum]KIL97725.1 ABC transporter ATP-binding protein [Paramagnetospirillum magnetotacticum MS-1]